MIANGLLLSVWCFLRRVSLHLATPVPAARAYWVRLD